MQDDDSSPGRERYLVTGASGFIVDKGNALGLLDNVTVRGAPREGGEQDASGIVARDGAHIWPPA